MVVVPVKAFERAKLRLAPALTAPERAALARHMAATVVAAAQPLRVLVVCDDPDVRAWAEALGVDVCWTPGLGLDGAVTAGVAAARAAGATAAAVCHADLPYARDLAAVVAEVPVGQVGLVPDRHEDGTNVAIVPTGAGFTFAYGPGSFGRHRAEAERLCLPVTVLRPVHLGWDVDEPGDLTSPEWAGAGVLATAGIEPTSAPSADAPRRSEPT